MKIEGVTRVEDLINNLPQAFADLGGNLSNGSTGTATVNLRNLGPQRTLVLVNSRRLMPGDPTQNGAASPDLNQIPAALIERVEVLTGGASAVYGADAVAGVVNFIMNDKFEGVRLDAQYSLYQHNNDSDIAQPRARAQLRAARQQRPRRLHQGHHVRRRHQHAGRPRQRDRLPRLSHARGDHAGPARLQRVRARVLRSGDPTSKRSAAAAPARRRRRCSRLTTRRSVQLRADRRVHGRRRRRAARLRGRPTSSTSRRTTTTSGRTSARRPACSRTTTSATRRASTPSSCSWTIAPRRRSRRAARSSAAAPASRRSSAATRSTATIRCSRPSAVAAFCGGNTGAGDVLLDIGRRNVEGGGRLDDLRHTSFRGVVGLRGDIADGWSYDVYGLYGTSILAENFQNDFSRARLRNALNAVTRSRPARRVCRINADADLTNDDPNCVPYNIFGVGSVTPDQLAYLQIPGLSEGETVEQVLSGSISGDLGQYGLKLPTANDGLGFAFGAEYRSERSELRTDAAFQTGDLAGQGAPTLDTIGSFDVKELFAEARLPLVQDKPFADTLSLEAGYRYSDYNLGFNTDTLQGWAWTGRRSAT